MRYAVILVVLGLVAPLASAQTARYELGRRLRAFEVAWEKADDAGKKRALKIIPKVTNQFFTFQLGEAGSTLDDARHALTSDKPRSIEQQWADSLYLELEKRVVDYEAKEVKVKILQFYTVKGDKPKGLRVNVIPSSRIPEGQALAVDAEGITADKLPVTVNVTLMPSFLGDNFESILRLLPRNGNQYLAYSLYSISRFHKSALGTDIKTMLDAGRETLPLDSLELATLTDRMGLLKSLATGAVLETDLPVWEMWMELAEMAPRGAARCSVESLTVSIRDLKADLEKKTDTTWLQKALDDDPKVVAKQQQVNELASEVKKLQAKLMQGAPVLTRAVARHQEALTELANLRKVLTVELPRERKRTLEARLNTAEKFLQTAKKELEKKPAPPPPFFTPDRAGQFWLTVPTKKAKTPCRLYVPKGLTAKKPVPLVIAQHGAGGSENMFFESYGAGHIVKLCEKRGWMLLAPRLGLAFVDGPVPLGEIVDKLAERYPIDPKAVFVVGHSMGASATIEAAQKYPGKFAAVAALGGGGKVKPDTAKVFEELPTFVGVGTADFALKGSQSLNKSLTDAGAKKLTFKEYEGIEHLLIVREALGDVFAIFDKAAGK